MTRSGIRASELIAKLKDMMKKHGDQQCFAGGTDYPAGVVGVVYRPQHKGDGYIPGDSFEVF